MDPQTNQLNLSAFNDTIFEIAGKLDKVLMVVVSCGFSLNTLPQETESNVYVETTSKMINKLKFFITAVQQLQQFPQSEQKIKFLELLIGRVKTFLKHLSEL